MDNAIPDSLRIGSNIAVLPVIHGSGPCALAVRRWMLEFDFDCIAIPLPESFRDKVEDAVLDLPQPGIVIQSASKQYPRSSEANETSWEQQPWSESSTWSEPEEEEQPPWSYVPIDPCQPVITAIRSALGERIHREYIDLETDPFLPLSAPLPDPYALRHVSPERFAAAILPSISRPADPQSRDRIRYMAWRLQELSKSYRQVLFVCSVLQWPWIRQAFQTNVEQPPDEDLVAPPQRYSVDPQTLLFLFGELPYITGLYERARADLEDDENLSVDGVKELLIAARDAYRSDLGRRAKTITPLLLSQCLKYIRNLSLIHRKMTPDLYTIVTASKQILGDQFSLHVVETARSYPYTTFDSESPVTVGIDQCRFPDGDIVPLVNRLSGAAMVWQTIRLQRRPHQDEVKRWQYRWNPFQQCSYPPEDTKIENFRARVFDRAKAISGADLATTEKFTTSVKDGIDIRDTLRHWYEQQIYVKVNPPNRGHLDACVMLFDSPADPRDYPWRTTWFAEHENESTLAFYATDFRREMVGPGIGLGIYGGNLFLFPPVVIPDIWNDRNLDFADSLEDRLIAAACMHGRGTHVALVSSLPPGAGWRRMAKRFKKQLLHIPLRSFNGAELQQLRMFHVLNGTQIRSYAADFIRRA